MADYVKVNKQVIGDCLKQCLEDYMVSAEDAIKQHQVTFMPSERFELAKRIEYSHKRMEMIMAAMHELGVQT